MTDYNDGKWHGWNGGECPVHPETIVNAKFSCGTECDTYRAEDFYWGPTPTNIVAFRVVKEYKEPKEVYSACGLYFSTKESAEWYVDLHTRSWPPSADTTIKTYREVLD